MRNLKRGFCHMRRTTREGLFLLLPSFILLFCITVFPLILAISISLREYDMSRYSEKPFVGVKNFQSVLGMERFRNSVKVSVTYAALAVTITLVLGMAMAVVFSSRKVFPWIAWSKFLLLLPMSIAPVAVGLMWQWFFSTQYGIVNYILGVFHLIQPEWSAKAIPALFSIVIADVWAWTPFVFLILLAAIESIPKDFYEAADLDGASSGQKFFHLTLPLIFPPILIVIFFRVILSFRGFDKFYIMTEGGPGIATESISFYISRLFFKFMKLGQAVSASFLLLAMILVFCELLFFYARRRNIW